MRVNLNVDFEYSQDQYLYKTTYTNPIHTGSIEVQYNLLDLFETSLCLQFKQAHSSKDDKPGPHSPINHDRFKAIARILVKTLGNIFEW